MTKILAESLYEFRKENNDDLNEARGLLGDLAAQGKQFRKMFPEAVDAMINKGKKENVPTLIKWLKKLNELGWPSDKELKAKLGEKSYKALQNINKALNNNLASMAVSPAGTQGGTTSKSEKSDVERIKSIAKVAGMEVQELIDLLKKK
jgi:hypothetical protein